MSDQLSIPCHGCGGTRLMKRVEAVAQSEDGPPFDLYQCPDAQCARKVVVLFEPAGGMTEDQETFIQREIARRGAFFPSDFTGSSGRREW